MKTTVVVKSNIGPTAATTIPTEQGKVKTQTVSMKQW